MIIRIILAGGLALAFLYAFSQRRKSRLVSRAIYVVTALGALVVGFPALSTSAAQFVGVGRGADLLFYCWIIISLLISINLHFRNLGLHSDLTRLAREIAILSARPPEA